MSEEPTRVTARVRAALAQIDRHDAELRAVITRLDDTALAQAAAGPEGELAGWTVALKDNIDTAGARTTAGSKFFADRVPDQDAFVVQRLRAAGAIFTAKVNLAEFALGATTDNFHYGTCRNAWDSSRIPAGSSGGSAVAVAVGMARVSLGTDTGGSVRLPAAVNGLVGLRPTWGRISVRGVTPLSATLDTVGPLGHTAADVATVFDIIDGYDAADPGCLDHERPPTRPELDRPLTGLRVGVPEGFFYADLDPGVATRVAEFATTLTELGAHVVPVELPEAELAQQHMFHIVYPEAAQFHTERLEREPDTFGPEVRDRLRLGIGIDARQMAAAITWRRQWQRRVEQMLTDVDVIVTPTMPGDVPPVAPGSMIATTHAITTFSYAWAMYAGPSLVVPCGFHRDSAMPVAAHVTGAPWAEHRLLNLAHQYQQVTEFHLARPPRMEDLDDDHDC